MDLSQIPPPTLERLPRYHRFLMEVYDGGLSVISSEQIGESCDVPGARVRRDLGYIGESGRSGIGYGVTALLEKLSEVLGLDREKEAIVVGAGHLGTALASYPGFARYGLSIVALFDRDPARVGTEVNGKPVLPMSALLPWLRRRRVRMAIVTVPAENAQKVADLIVEGGITAIWNFAPVKLNIPAEVIVVDEDLASHLATLSFRLAHRDAFLPESARRTAWEEPEDHSQTQGGAAEI